MRRKLSVRGVVQGVGFRPFVFNLACQCGLAGNVYNEAAGVYIEIEGFPDALDEFTRRLQGEPPPLARIQEVRSEEIPATGESGFEILLSRDTRARSTLIPPDIATCAACRRELFDPGDRRYRYPFINCTHCGPRFTIVQGIPYDRPLTTMSVFPMCPDCAAEYENPRDRRFHAQPNACPRCGPQLQLVNSEMRPIPVEDSITEAAQWLHEGKTLALKGMGGFHLACSALDSDAVKRLRVRKRRIQKPFAIMLQDLAMARGLCLVSDEEARLLQSYAAPVVLLRKRPDCPVAESVAPNLEELGVMLPYTPLHLLLLDAVKIPLVMTSANFSEEPIAYRESEDRKTIVSLSDAVLLHNRVIHIRCDDSVSRIWRGRERLVRRSRGYTPLPLVLSLRAKRPILACGALLKNTFCLVKEDQFLLSHHIGDLENLETLRSFEEGIQHFETLFRCRPEVVVCDLHPDYLSTRYAEKRAGERLLMLQHHKAHVAACMADNNDFAPVIGVAWDGLGYGEDGKIWGGEFFVGDLSELKRVAHLSEGPQPGGDTATREPWRMALSHLHSAFGAGWRDTLEGVMAPWPKRPVALVESMLAQNINLPRTTSVGRLFDAVAALVLGIETITYEGEAAIYLEALSRRASDLDKSYPFSIIHRNGHLQVAPEEVFQRVLRDLKAGVSRSEIGYRFHRGLAETIVAVAGRLREEHRLSRVALSGGVFQNTLLSDLTVSLLEEAAFQVLTHSQVPTNDGGIALGQAAWAAWNDQG
ncbi:MAG TPA: carbamoyltransferase HypF [Firmicutes bacterium]|nr:carbamoyltransferase HypF [Bacillota bacterium]